MKNIFYLFILNMAICQVLVSQQSPSPKIVMKNRLKTIESYVFETLESNDSFLIKKDSFNSMGFVVSTEIYGMEGLRNSYLYKYQDDTLRVERITMFRDRFQSKTKIWYDKKNREVKAVDYNKNGKKTGTRSKTKYDDKQKTKHVKIYVKGKTPSIEYTTKYDESGKLIEHWTWINGKWVLKPIEENNANRDEIENYEGTTNTYSKTWQIIKEDVTSIGVKGKLSLKKDDILVTETIQSKEDLILSQKQYLNEVLQGLQIKRFTFY
jgi:hypothetical protein